MGDREAEKLAAATAADSGTIWQTTRSCCRASGSRPGAATTASPTHRPAAQLQVTVTSTLAARWLHNDIDLPPSISPANPRPDVIPLPFPSPSPVPAPRPPQRARPPRHLLCQPPRAAATPAPAVPPRTLSVLVTLTRVRVPRPPPPARCALFGCCVSPEMMSASPDARS